MIKIVFILLISFSVFSFGYTKQQKNAPEKYGAHVVNHQKINFNEIIKNVKTNKLLKAQSASRPLKGSKGGNSIKMIAFDEELGILQLTRKSTRDHLNRDLFKSPDFTATFFKAVYDNNSIHIDNTYIQLMSDSDWDRLLYGSLNGQLKSYSIKNPGEIAVNSFGMVFIAERDNARIQVLQLESNSENMDLKPLFMIEDLGSVNSLAYNDGGTAFDINDDFIFVSDASSGALNYYSISKDYVEKQNTFKEFRGPSAITFGRADGLNTKDLYVIDYYSKHLTRYGLDGDVLVKKNQITGLDTQTFSSLETDHFGQIYIADIVNNEISKYTYDLEYLDGVATGSIGLQDLNIPFGSVEIKGKDRYWVGFDQLFSLNAWSEESGIQRYKLQPVVKSFDLFLSGNGSLQAEFFITDYVNTQMRIYDNRNTLIYESEQLTSPSGLNLQTWNRKTANHEQVAAGNYSLVLEFHSLYDDKIISRKSDFYLPLFYHSQAGTEDNTQEFNLLNGQLTQYDGLNVIEASDCIEYRIANLNPSSEYELAVQSCNTSQQSSTYEISANGKVCAEINADPGQAKSDFIPIASDIIHNGQLNVVIRNANDGKVSISDLWFRESGIAFSAREQDIKIPSTFKLDQNFPNPFNPETTIRFHLPRDSEVKVAVYDMLGRKVATLVDAFELAGVHTVNFDARGLASGIYFYRIEAGDFNQVKRMLVIK